MNRKSYIPTLREHTVPYQRIQRHVQRKLQEPHGYQALRRHGAEQMREVILRMIEERG